MDLNGSHSNIGKVFHWIIYTYSRQSLIINNYYKLFFSSIQNIVVILTKIQVYSVNILYISDVVLYLYFLVNLLSLLLTYINVTIIYIIFLRKKIWDYAITVAVFHLAVTCVGKILKWTICISYTLIFQSQYCSSSQIGVKSQEFVLFIKSKFGKEN